MARRKAAWLGDRGSVAIETAIVVPVIFLIILGSLEVYLYYRTSEIVRRTAASVADAVAAQQFLCDSMADDSAQAVGFYLSAAKELMQPMDLGKNGAVVITAIPAKESAGGWQRASRQGSGMTSHYAPGVWPADIGLRSGAVDDGMVVVVVEVFYTYTPFVMTGAFWSEAPGKTTLYRSSFFPARVINSKNGNLARLGGATCS